MMILDEIIKDYQEIKNTFNGYIENFTAFTQVWASTSLGFGGIGGSAMTKAVTTIIYSKQKYYVFFGGRLAYCVSNPTEEFYNDIKNCRMKNCETAKKVY